MKRFIAILCALCMALSALPALGETETGVANPWQETTAEGLLDALDIPFEVPEGAEGVAYRLMGNGELGEIQFTMNEVDFTFRMQVAEAFTDISGLYYTWEYEESDELGRCEAKFMQVTEGENTIQLMLWFDEITNYMYSLSAIGKDLDGFDLKAVAEQVYVCAQDDPNAYDFSEIYGIPFEFSSGAGAWSTEMEIDDDGFFTGNYHDSEMGESSDAYPDGTVYGCSFHGLLTGDSTPVADGVWELTIEELELDEGQLPETIEDGIRYVTTEPYGLKQGHKLYLYTPGVSLEDVPEDCLSWLHLNENGENVTSLPCYALYDPEDGYAFVGYEVE